MPVADVFDIDAQKIGEIDLREDIVSMEPKLHLFPLVLRMQFAAKRRGTACTKTRSEVRGSSRKPWRQKGTGRARHGSRRSAQWVGGGKIHTPRPRDYSQKMPLKMRRAALRSALSAKAADNGIMVVDEVAVAEPKTKLMAESLNNLVGDATVLVLLPGKDENYEVVVRSTNNLPKAKTLLASYLNIRDLLGYDRVIVPLKALDVISGYLG